jgi:1-acyl-sn-glycerol-3-phosphate acyltransferase
MLALRLLRVMLHLLTGLLICGFIFPFKSFSGRQVFIRRWSHQLLGICRVRLEIVNPGMHNLESSATVSAGKPAPSLTTASMRSLATPCANSNHGVVVANHVSWLDIFVINALQPCRFVAKSEILNWPLVGRLCAQAGTIFISRGSVRAVRKTFQHLGASVVAGERVAFFPEGTTAAQGGLLPFHANLFEAAIDAKVPILPLALRYLDSDDRLYAGVHYIDDTSFAQSIVTILRGPVIRAQIIMLPPIPSDADKRRPLAIKTHQAILAALNQAPPECA